MKRAACSRLPASGCKAATCRVPRPKARRALEELLQEVCEALWAPLPFRRGQANDKREIGELFNGLRRTLKERAKSQLQPLEPLLKNLEADVGATLERRRACQPRPARSERGESCARTHRGARRALVVPRMQDARLAPGHARRRHAAGAASPHFRRWSARLTSLGSPVPL